VQDASENGITVSLYDQREYKAELVGTDPLTDLAVIKIDTKGEKIEPAHFGDIANVKIGQMVLAVGNPLGLTSTVTSGIVSAISRGNIGGGRSGGYNIENYIQTDAAINPGNSGGGLFNVNGSLIGINTAIATRTGTYIGYGFAIPIDIVKSVVADIMDDGKVSRGYIGVTIRSVDATFAKSLGLEKAGGVFVNGVLEDSPAEKAGIKEGDVILSLNGKELNSSNELQGQIVLHKAGDVVDLVVWRNDKKINLKVKLESRDEKEEIAIKSDSKEKDETKEKSDEPLEFDKLGFSVKPLSKQMKKDFEVESGVYVHSVKRFSAAAERGLFPNGVIIEADRKKVSSTGGLQKIIDSKSSGDAILLQVKYKETTQFVAIEIP
jgi:serine protease Do